MAMHRRVPAPRFETARLILLPIGMDDAPRIQKLFANPNVLRHMNAVIPFPYPPDGAVSFLETILPRIEAFELYAWSIVEREMPEQGLIGSITLDPLSEADSRGFWLGEPYWRRGFMKEATTAVTDFAFDELGMDRLLLSNAEKNGASHRLKEISGAEVIGREEANFTGGPDISVKWRLTRGGWRSSPLKRGDVGDKS
ncbi:N-acetyltransferase [bacterium]|nr:MAG: N-acetyltransferase [bacterium]